MSEIAIEAKISQSAAKTVNLHSCGNQWRQILFKQWRAVNQIVHSFMNGGLVRAYSSTRESSVLVPMLVAGMDGKVTQLTGFFRVFCS